MSKDTKIGLVVVGIIFLLVGVMIGLQAGRGEAPEVKVVPAIVTHSSTTPSVWEEHPELMDKYLYGGF